MDDTPAPAPARAAPEPEPTELSVQAQRKKKKDKLRSAWISFIGRIVAQIVGAIASIALAITFLQKTRNDEATPSPAVSAPAPSAAAPRVNRRDDPRLTLAVLPLSNFSTDAQQDYFADGMTEALIADLAQLDGLRVISRTSVMQYRTQQKQIPQIADELGADMIVEGSVVRSGDRVRVTAQLIDAERDVHVWARSYERTLRDVLSLQGQLAAEIAKEVRVALTPLQQGRFAARAVVDPAVYDLYLRGRHAWNLRTEAGFNAAATYFQDRALELNPQLELARTTLAKALYQQGAFAEVVKIGDAGPQPANPDLTAVVGLAHLRSGATAQADAILQTLRSQSPLPVMALSMWYSAIGDRDQAMAMLTRGTTPGAFPPSVAVDPLFDPLRADARFVSLLNRNLL